MDAMDEMDHQANPKPIEHVSAEDLVRQVIEERKLWIASWHPQLVDPARAMIEEYSPNTAGVAPGSCQLKVGDRVIAKFVVRFKEEPIGCEIEADWPSVPADDSNRAGLVEVVFEQMAGRVDFACEELGLEGTAPSVEEMKRKLHARFGFRFNFRRV